MFNFLKEHRLIYRRRSNRFRGTSAGRKMSSSPQLTNLANVRRGLGGGGTSGRSRTGTRIPGRRGNRRGTTPQSRRSLVLGMKNKQKAVREFSKEARSFKKEQEEQGATTALRRVPPRKKGLEGQQKSSPIVTVTKTGEDGTTTKEQHIFNPDKKRRADDTSRYKEMRFKGQFTKDKAKAEREARKSKDFNKQQFDAEFAKYYKNEFGTGGKGTTTPPPTPPPTTTPPPEPDREPEKESEEEPVNYSGAFASPEPSGGGGKPSGGGVEPSIGGGAADIREEEEEGGTLPTPSGVAPPTTQTNAPVVTPTGTPVSFTYPPQTRSNQEASDALTGGDIEAPTSLKTIVQEEQAAISPEIDAATKSRNRLKIYSATLDTALAGRSADIEEYKNESKSTARKIANAKIDQSKSNRDLEIETIKESRDRQRRDENLEQEKIERDYEKLIDQQREYNMDELEAKRTSLGARYGGFGSGAGLKNIRKVEEKGQAILRNIEEDKIYARREHLNSLEDIENEFKLERKTAYNAVDNAITDAYNVMQEAAITIDGKALDEEGDKFDKALTLLQDTFEKFEAIEDKEAKALSGANQRALDRRDAVRKENYERNQDLIANIFTGADKLGSSSPFLAKFEEELGITPGTIASMKTPQEQRIAVSWANHNLNMQEFDFQKNQVDKNASDLTGQLRTADGKLLRDPAGNPVNIADGGSVTGNYQFDSVLFGEGMVGMSGARRFSKWALSNGDIVPKGNESPHHTGGEYDIDGEVGDPITPMMPGTVIKVNKDPNDKFGIYVDLSDGTYTYRYAHMSSVSVGEGDTVEGHKLGAMGNTGQVLDIEGNVPTPEQLAQGVGSHMHFEVRDNPNDWESGKTVDPMNIYADEGDYLNGNIKWVDNMRDQLRSGQAPVGSSAEGGTFSAVIPDQSESSWFETDQQVLDYAEDYFKEDGKLNTKAYDLVLDYLWRTKKGNYSVTPGGEGASEGVRQASKEIEYSNQMYGRKDTATDRKWITSGKYDSEVFYEDLQNGELDEMPREQATMYMRDLGYVVSERGIGHSVREMTDSELLLLNQERQFKGLPPLD